MPAKPIRLAAAAVVAIITAAACDTSPLAPPRTPTSPAKVTPTSTPAAVEFSARAALETIAVLTAEIGPREATGPAYRRAADFVQQRLTGDGYAVQRQPVRVPAGVSWGVRVPAGTTYNVIASPPGFDGQQRHIVLGAHLDTVPQAPGAEDNASGVAVLLELARMAAASRPRIPVVFLAFGAEEPRGRGDTRHHYGSRAYVASRPPPIAMASLDRVGVGDDVRVCTGGRGPRTVARELLAAAQRHNIATTSCQNRSSDHWSFEKAGVPAARLGGAPYAEYHSARDRVDVVDPAQLARAGTVVWEWLSAQR